MSSTIPSPHANSFVIGTAVINTHTHTHTRENRRTSKKEREIRERAKFKKMHSPEFISA
jgi:hypothetical protein